MVVSYGVVVSGIVFCEVVGPGVVSNTTFRPGVGCGAVVAPWVTGSGVVFSVVTCPEVVGLGVVKTMEREKFIVDDARFKT